MGVPWALSPGSLAERLAGSLAGAPASVDPLEALLALLERVEALGLEAPVLRVVREVSVEDVEPGGLVEGQARLLCSRGPGLRAVLSCLEPGRAAATAAARGGGLLSGVGVLVKDNIDHVGFPTTLGTGYYSVRPRRSSPASALLEAAGAVVLGKANLHELALGTTNVNPHTGTPVNPACPGRVPGGSSGGSASAVAAGLALASLANDAAGSIRVPAAFTGVYGFKPGSRYLPGGGARPRAPGLGAHGFIARSPADVVALVAAFKPWAPQAVLGALEAYHGQAPRVLVPVDLLDSAEPPVRAAFNESIEAMEQAGWRVERGSLGLPGWLDRARAVATLTAALEDFLELYRASRGRMGRDVAMLLELAEGLPGWSYLRARRLLRAARRRLLERLRGYDAVVTPTVPVEPPRVEDADPRLSASTRLIEYTAPWNSLDLPAASLPGAARLPCGAPVGVQLATAHGEDRLLALSILAEAAMKSTGETGTGGEAGAP